VAGSRVAGAWAGRQAETGNRAAGAWAGRRTGSRAAGTGSWDKVACPPL